MANEIELKLALAPQGLQVLKQSWLPRQSVESQERQQLGNIYFDTPERALNRHKVALRLRVKDGQYIQTLKTKGQSQGGLHQRGEWEWEVAEPRLYPELLQGTAFPQDVEVETLAPLFRTDFERTAVLLRRGEALIELALDEGLVIAGERQAPILEAELELKQGNLAELFALAQELAAEVPVWLSDVSKAERGYRLGLAQSLQSETSQPLLPLESWGRGLYRNWLRRMEAFRAQPALQQALRLMQSLAALQAAVAGLADWSLDPARRQMLAEQLAAELAWLEGLTEKLSHNSPENVLAEFEASRRAGQLSLEFSQWFAEA